MSKIGKAEILIPSGVEIRLEAEGVLVKGPKGELLVKVHPDFKVEIGDKTLSVLPPKVVTKETSAIWGTTRALIQNAVLGVINIFQKKLEIEGVGYRVAVEGDKLSLNIGLSHPVKLPIPKGITIVVDKNNSMMISGIDKDLVGRTAAVIRSQKKPEPYKGKGIKYAGEVIRRKDGKKAAGTTS